MNNSERSNHVTCVVCKAKPSERRLIHSEAGQKKRISKLLEKYGEVIVKRGVICRLCEKKLLNIDRNVTEFRNQCQSRRVKPSIGIARCPPPLASEENLGAAASAHDSLPNSRYLTSSTAAGRKIAAGLRFGSSGFSVSSNVVVKQEKCLPLVSSDQSVRPLSVQTPALGGLVGGIVIKSEPVDNETPLQNPFVPSNELGTSSTKCSMQIRESDHRYAKTKPNVKHSYTEPGDLCNWKGTPTLSDHGYSKAVNA